jgi:hypothetical protein
MISFSLLPVTSSSETNKFARSSFQGHSIQPSPDSIKSINTSWISKKDGVRQSRHTKRHHHPPQRRQRSPNAMGRMIKVQPGADGIIRTATSTLDRSIKRLVPLPSRSTPDDSDTINSDNVWRETHLTTSTISFDREPLNGGSMLRRPTLYLDGALHRIWQPYVRTSLSRILNNLKDRP